MTQLPGGSADWLVFQRWAQYEGEWRTGVLRVVCISSFYLIHCWRYLSISGYLPSWGVLQLGDASAADQQFHLLVTLLAFGWICVSANVFIVLRNRIFPIWMPWATCATDIVFLTSLLCLSQGPRSPLTTGFFLLIALSGLRFTLPLVRFTTIGCMIGYLCVLGRAKWPERFGQSTEVDLTIPRYHQLIMLLAIAIAGILIGQITRHVHRFVAAQERAIHD